ncbi:transmembrane protein, putative (macronuclear) [Tetrahymena thermophila SB210]|uniref:Transmembrane protein, putative n=1 Tax=Tetrahymena thermophila (strain SB210) TaxID=312017 RepID=I7LY07_TETTS|nr:transmembrane protein, putative [Tetrahymena thermophila SB210]EAS07119.2 transmembrane protein, putative [Tetrahymena thermophila SB210]|eukprot:XP_001027361.2 transmembrane protein, putative [Tetrahymena thermophila SB210]
MKQKKKILNLLLILYESVYILQIQLYVCNIIIKSFDKFRYIIQFFIKFLKIFINFVQLTIHSIILWVLLNYRRLLINLLILIRNLILLNRRIVWINRLILPLKLLRLLNKVLRILRRNLVLYNIVLLLILNRCTIQYKKLTIPPNMHPPNYVPNSFDQVVTFNEEKFKQVESTEPPLQALMRINFAYARIASDQSPDLEFNYEHVGQLDEISSYVTMQVPSQNPS